MLRLNMNTKIVVGIVTLLVMVGLVVASGVYSPPAEVVADPMRGGTSAVSGVIMWGETTATDATVDTGDEVCAIFGYTCSTTQDVIGTDIACATAHTVRDHWLAFCK